MTATATAPRNEAALDYEALLAGLPDNTLAWMANEYASKPRRDAWASREEAIGAILNCREALPDNHPTKDLIWRWAQTRPLAQVIADSNRRR